MSNSRPCALFVDDEPSVLGALKRAFRHERFDCETASSPSEALRKLNEREFAVVVSDYRMPEMSGVELLYLIREVHPKTKRILLTGQADLEGVIAAVNDGGIHKFHVKPWDNNALSGAISDCLNLYWLEEENRKLGDELESANEALYSLNTDLTSQLATTVMQRDDSHHYDKESGLPNTNLFVTTLKKHLQKPILHSQMKKRLVVVALGLKNQTTIETSLGTQGIDNAILSMRDSLQASIREHDLLARVRSDALALACWVEGDDTRVIEFAKRLAAATTHPESDAGRNFHITSCAGVSICKENDTCAATLLEHAVVAMHQARTNKSVPAFLYCESEHAQTSAKLRMIHDLHLALENDEFFLEFQPRVNPRDGEVVAAEALLRWEHPQNGRVSPAEFVPLLEETGLILQVGEWCIQQVCRVARSLLDQKSPLLIAVNISPAQFHNTQLHQSIDQAASSAGISPAECLELEITESLLVSDLENAGSTICELRDLGIKLAIDDFGTGYSSLNYLVEIPADYLKIDRSFITQIHSDTRSHSVVKAILSIARALDMQIIAEGVELREQADALTAMGCDEIQGYYFSPPVSESRLYEIARSGIQNPQLKTA
ncbi:MAG: EAL domain-containing protein [Pseudomonadota bacterium]